MKKLIAILIAIVSMTLLVSCGDKPRGEMRDITTMELVSDMKIGINLGNTFDCHGDWYSSGGTPEDVQTAWGSPVITQEIIQCYADAGFGVMRLPVSWQSLMEPGGKIDKRFIDNVEKVVGWILDSGMYCILNMHHESWINDFSTDYDTTLEKYEYVWTQIAQRFMNYGDKLMFESMNEVGFDNIWNQYAGDDGKDEAFRIFNSINQKFVDTVRSTGGNNAERHLLIASYCTSIELACDPVFKMPDDPMNRLAVSVHYYTPSTLCLISEDVEWGKARNDWGSSEDYEELYMWMDMMEDNYTKKGIPVIVGEFGCFGNNKTDEVKQGWMLDVAEAAYVRDMCPILWDTPGDEFDRELLHWWHKDFIEKLVGIAGNN